MANGDSSGLILNLDKISYGVAGVLVLVLLAIPLMSGGDLASLQDTVRETEAALRAKDPDFDRKAVPPIRANIEKQWAIGESTPLPAWLSERRPALLQLVEATAIIKVAHAEDGAPSLDRIEYLRDAERMRPYLKVSGSCGKFNYPEEGVFTRAVLSRREGEGEYAKIEELDASSGSIEFSDFDVEAGKTYAYRMVVAVGVKPGAKNAIVDPEKRTAPSNELGITDPVPHDFSINVINMRGFDPAKNKDAHFFGSIEYADYAKAGEITKLATKEYMEGFEFGPKTDKGRMLWIIRPIDDSTLTVMNTLTRDKEALSAREARRPIELPDPVEKVEEVATEEPGAEEPAAGDTPAVPEAPTPKPEKPKKPSSGGGIFK